MRGYLPVASVRVVLAAAAVATGQAGLTHAQAVNFGEAQPVNAGNVRVTVGEAVENREPRVSVRVGEAVERSPVVVRVGEAVPVAVHRAQVHLSYVERTSSLSHTVRFDSQAFLESDERTGYGALRRDFQGRGTGDFVEEAALVEGPCGGVKRTGPVTMEVTVQRENSEVNVRLSGTLRRFETGSCNAAYTGTGAGTSPDYTCDFYNVDVEHGGTFKANDDSDYQEGDNVHDWECTLVLDALGPPSPISPLPRLPVVPEFPPVKPPPSPPSAEDLELLEDLQIQR